MLAWGSWGGCEIESQLVVGVDAVFATEVDSKHGIYSEFEDCHSNAIKWLSRFFLDEEIEVLENWIATCKCADSLQISWTCIRRSVVFS